MSRMLNHERDSGDIESWLSAMDPMELKANGWTPDAVLTICKSQGHCLLYDDKSSLSSVLVFQKLADQLYEILFLATAPQCRRRGHQLQLFSAFIVGNPGTVWLECRADNQAALHLYGRCGFQVTGQRARYYKDGMNAILMEFSQK